MIQRIFIFFVFLDYGNFKYCTSDIKAFNHLFVANYYILEYSRLQSSSCKVNQNLRNPKIWHMMNQELAVFGSKIVDTIATSPMEPLVPSRPGVCAAARRYSSSTDDAYDLEGGPRDYRCACGAPQNISPHGKILSYSPAEEYSALIGTQLPLNYHVCIWERNDRLITIFLFGMGVFFEFFTLIRSLNTWQRYFILFFTLTKKRYSSWKLLSSIISWRKLYSFIHSHVFASNNHQINI